MPGGRLSQYAFGRSMTKLVVLKFHGSLKSGFLVNSEIAREGKSAERGCAASLPPARVLNYHLTIWKQRYSCLDSKYRIKPQQIIYNGSIEPKRQLAESARKLQLEFSRWLASPSFSPIDKHLREELNRSEPARILICCDRPQIYQLPWCCWDLLESYPNLEIALSSPNFTRVPILSTPKRKGKVRILAILGDSQGIDLKADYDLLDTLDAELVKFLVEPTIAELYDCLWRSTWDIVFFAGHSKTLERQGILYLNERDRLTIEQLKHGFKQAIASGLQLAIFNSCDGLGLAAELGQLSLPQSIVMRLPIPDTMAQQFAKYFLQAYAGGNSLYLAVRQAREQLQSYEQEFPCASWLPVIYQNPAVIPPQWSSFRPADPPAYYRFEDSILQRQFRAIISIAIIATIFTLLVQSVGWLESAELNAYDRLSIWRYDPPVDKRVLVVTVNDLDRTFQQERGMAMNMRGSLTDAALNQLVQKLTAARVRAIASDIIHDFPFEPELAETIAQTHNFVAICRVKNPPQLVSIAPPDRLNREQLGFSNWAIDNDGGIRRQLLGMSADDVCTSGLSLGLRLALVYLGDISTEFDSQSDLAIDGTVFPRLQTTSGGYQLPETQGYQILLDYRRALPATVPLRSILTMPQTEVERLAKDKIVLIGVEGHNQDLHHTPYSRGQQAKRFPGVLIHALMTSQIVDIVLGEQKPMSWVDSWLETFWLAWWSLVGATIIFISRRSPIKILVSIILGLGTISICCWLLLLNKVWLIAIAPALALIFAATITLAYVKK